MLPYKIDKLLDRCAPIENPNRVAGQISQRRDMFNKDLVSALVGG